MGPNNALVAGSVLCNTCAIPYIPVKRNHAFANKNRKKHLHCILLSVRNHLAQQLFKTEEIYSLLFFSCRYIFLHRCLLLVGDDRRYRREVLSCLNQKG